jgi:hypothetical protein
LFERGLGLPGVAKQKVERRARDRAFAARRLKADRLALAAYSPNGFLEIGEVDLGEVAAERTAGGLAGKEVVEVAPHRLGLAEP